MVKIKIKSTFSTNRHLINIVFHNLSSILNSSFNTVWMMLDFNSRLGKTVQIHNLSEYHNVLLITYKIAPIQTMQG